MKRNTIIAAIVLGLFILGIGTWFLFFSSPTQIDDRDQTLENFGVPTSFAINFDKERSERIEVWSYQKAGIALLFVNGRYFKAFPSGVREEGARILSYSPQKLVFSMTLNDVNKLEGAAPAVSVPFKKEFFPDAVIHIYPSGLVIIAFSDEIVGFNFQ